MSKAQYEIYMRKVYDLAHTLVIKSRTAADSINKHLMSLGRTVNEADPTTWKYYLNLAGRYHATDRMMTVTSLDTLQTIDFTRENLLEHRATYREYAFGTRFYNELVNRYPDQEMLIRGILSPVDMAQAIAAPDGRVLDWNRDLVEENETNLIPRISEWCEGFMVRWNVAAFAETDELYPAAQLAVLYANLPLVICNIRLSNCHTPYAHSYHIREYLASNGRLDSYVDHLTKKQMLWLYRNIRYIHRNAGKQATFHWLIDNIMTSRGLPLAEWSMRHNLRDQISEIYPDIEFTRRQLNFGATSAGVDTCNLGELLTKEQPAAKGNARVQADMEPIITELMENSISNRLSTKVLESSILDMTDASVYTRSDCLLNHWLYLAATNQYTAIVAVENPKTGDLLTLTPKDAFVVFLYAFNKARGLTLPQIPLLQAINVRRQPTPTKAKLRSLVESRHVTEQMIDKALDVLVPLRTYISTDAFYDAMLKVHEGQLKHRLMYVTQEHMETRVQTEILVSHLYGDITCDLGAGTAYDDWFADKGLDIPTFTELECDLLANALLKQATGNNLKTSLSLKDMQAAMLRLMAQLSSYSVQYLQSINSDPIQVVEWPAIRVGDDAVKGGDFTAVDMIDVRLQDIHALGRELLQASLDKVAPESAFYARALDKDFKDIRVDETLVDRDVVRLRIPIQPVRVLRDVEKIDRVEDVEDKETQHYAPVQRAGLEAAFLSLSHPQYVLTSAERTTLQTRWRNYDNRLLSRRIRKTELDGLTYPVITPIATTELNGLQYPDISPIHDTELNGLTYPDITPIRNTELDGLNYPDVSSGSNP